MTCSLGDARVLAAAAALEADSGVHPHAWAMALAAPARDWPYVVVQGEASRGAPDVATVTALVLAYAGVSRVVTP